MAHPEPGVYKLTNVKAGVAMDLSGGDQQSVIAFSPHGGPNQQASGGGYAIRNVGLNKFLTFPDEANDGKQVICAGDDPNNTRIWDIRIGHEGVNVKDPEPSVRIFVRDTNKNLDLKDHGDATAGNIVQLWERTAGKGQAWYFERVN